MQFLPLSAMLTPPPPPPPLPPLRHFRTLYPMHTTLSILLCHPFPSIILSPFIFATIQTVGTPPRREKGGRRRVVREGRGEGGRGGMVRRRNGEGKKISSVAETSREQRVEEDAGMDFVGWEVELVEMTRERTGESPYFFVPLLG